MKTPLWKAAAVTIGLAFAASAGLYLAFYDGQKAPKTLTGTVTGAPPYDVYIAALGCAQVSRYQAHVKEGVLLQNIGKVALKMLPGDPGSTAQPVTIPPGLWAHYTFSAEGGYIMRGSRSSCTSAGIAAPHFWLSVTVVP